MLRAGIEPATIWSRVMRFTNWAIWVVKHEWLSWRVVEAVSREIYEEISAGSNPAAVALDHSRHGWQRAWSSWLWRLPHTQKVPSSILGARKCGLDFQNQMWVRIPRSRIALGVETWSETKVDHLNLRESVYPLRSDDVISWAQMSDYGLRVGRKGWWYGEFSACWASQDRGVKGLVGLPNLSSRNSNRAFYFFAR